VILWTRLEAVEIPPEQAIDVAPQGELVAIGAAYLLVLGFFGALAVMGAFLVDRSARPTPGMARTLLGLLAVEGMAAIVFVDGPSMLATLVACELFVLPLGAAFVVTMVATFGELEDDLRPRGRELCDPEEQRGLFRPEVNHPLFVLGPIGLVLAAMIAAAVLIACGASTSLMCWILSGFAVIFAVWFAVLVICDHREGLRQRKAQAGEKPKPAAPKRRPRRKGGLLRWLVDRIFGKREEDIEPSTVDTSPRVDTTPTCDEKGREKRDKRRRSLPRPRRLALRPWGFGLIFMAMAIGVVLVVARMGTGEWWLGVSLAVAAVIVAALWRISELVNKRLVWFGVAVFLSVPLFGTLMTVVKNIAHPKVQPLALIRKTDGPRESIQGLYVTETSDRVYFANIATEGCREDVVPKSGRLLSLPKDEVIAMSLGPLQSVKEAGNTALEMSYALTPSVETPEASVLLPGDEARRKKAEEEEAEASWTDTRLENAGPAVRPDFGAGLRLEPEDAEPGDKVTLTMSAPNKEIGGFGRSREGHTLRIGGVVADIAKERAHRVEGAEYIQAVKDGEERLIKLADEGPYVRADDGSYPLLSKADPEDVGPETPLYVKLDEPRLRAVDNRPAEDDVYVEVSSGGGMASVVGRETRAITLAGGPAEGRTQKPVTVELANRPLYRQAWHEKRVTFTVPEEARTGVVTVECNQLAGSPLLQVSHDPTARIAVRMQAHTPAVTLDSSRSSDEDEGDEITRRWIVEGVRRGHGKALTTQLPVRDAPYSVELTVTDATGHTDTAKLKLLRLPASTFEFDGRKPMHRKAMRAARRTLVRAVRAQPPAAIELDGHADDPGTPAYNLKLSLERDDVVRERLLEPKKSKKKKMMKRAAGHGKAKEGLTVPVQELAFGETCQLDRHAGRQPRNRRVDVFVLDEGVSVSPPTGCHPGHFKSTRWRLPE
jgi:outer membrane protein OmpA-like peptidoglycan-associated protein